MQTSFTLYWFLGTSGTEGSEFIVTDGKGIDKTNQQIIVFKLPSVLKANSAQRAIFVKI